MRCAIIGLGVIGKLHAKTLSDQGKEIVALCDIDEAAAVFARDKFAPNAKIYTDWQEMADTEKLDAIHVCTPHYLHAPMVIGLLRRNINVLCEKPLCIKESEIDDIIKAEKESSAQLGVCHQNRYKPSNLFLKNYLADKEIACAHGSVVWHRGADYYRSAAWRGTQEQEGGGVLINQALHTLDLLLWLCGEPESVAASAENLSLKGEIEVEDTVAAAFYGKVPFNFFATNSSACNMPVELGIKLVDGKHISSFPNFAVVDGEFMSFGEKSSEGYGKSYYGNTHGTLFEDFYDCIATGRKFPIDAAEAAKVIRLILAVYKSGTEKVGI